MREVILTLSNSRSAKMAFRIQSQTFFLTYPQCNLQHEEVKELLKAKEVPRFKIKSYLIAKEKHADGIAEHFHVYLKLEKKFNCNNQEWFDIRGFHPNIQSCRSPADVIAYASKDGDYIKSDDISIEKKVTWSEIDTDMHTVNEFMKNVKKHFPKEYWLHYDKIKSTAEQHFKVENVYEAQVLASPAVPLDAMLNWCAAEYPKVRK